MSKNKSKKVVEDIEEVSVSSEDSSSSTICHSSSK